MQTNKTRDHVSDLVTIDRFSTITQRVSMMIKRMMREIARRLKRMVFGWRPEGAAKMTRTILKRFMSAREWEKYWRKRLKISGDVILTLSVVQN